MRRATGGLPECRPRLALYTRNPIKAAIKLPNSVIRTPASGPSGDILNLTFMFLFRQTLRAFCPLTCCNRDSHSVQFMARTMSELRMIPTDRPSGRHYVAEGNWNLAGGMDRTHQRSNWRVRMVAGARFELATFGL